MDEIAIASVPMQKWSTPDETPDAFLTGSIFEELRKPFYVEEQMKKHTAGRTGTKSCGCEPNGDRETMLWDIQKEQFFLIDLQLYIDTHPQEQEAKHLKQKCLNRCKEMKERFAKEHYPLTMQCEGDELNAGIPWEGGKENVAL